MKILVTGASGFAGSHLLEALQAKGYAELYGTAYGNVEALSSIIPSSNIITINLTEGDEVQKMIQRIQPDWIFHLASFAFVGQSFERGAELLQNNLGVQISMLEAVRQHAPKARILVIGSAEEYGLSEDDESPISESHPLRPVNPYAVSKVAQDLLAYSYAVSLNMNIVRVRPFNHIGERQTPDFAVPAFAKQIVAIERGQQDALFVGNLTGIRDFTDVKDMMRAYIVIMEKGTVGDVYNIGTGVGIKMSDIVDQLVTMSTAKISIKQDEKRFRPLDIPEIIADASKVKDLGWNPEIPLQDTLKRVLAYWRTM